MREPNFTAAQWIAWLGATLIAACTLTVFAFNEFETKENARDRAGFLEKHLDSIEKKLDRLSERTR